jgi:hypothetical protein
VLPLTAGTRIAVVGPHGNATRELIQVDTGKICPGGNFDCVVSPFQAIATLNNHIEGGSTTFTQGVGIVDNDTTGIAAAVAAAQAADVVVIGVGISECGGWWGGGGSAEPDLARKNLPPHATLLPRCTPPYSQHHT